MDRYDRERVQSKCSMKTTWLIEQDLADVQAFSKSQGGFRIVFSKNKPPRWEPQSSHHPLCRIPVGRGRASQQHNQKAQNQTTRAPTRPRRPTRCAGAARHVRELRPKNSRRDSAAPCASAPLRHRGKPDATSAWHGGGTYAPWPGLSIPTTSAKARHEYAARALARRDQAILCSQSRRVGKLGARVPTIPILPSSRALGNGPAADDGRGIATFSPRE